MPIPAVAERRSASRRVNMRFEDSDMNASLSLLGQCILAVNVEVSSRNGCCCVWLLLCAETCAGGAEIFTLKADSLFDSDLNFAALVLNFTIRRNSFIRASAVSVADKHYAKLTVLNHSRKGALTLANS